jgi:adenosylhomocysteine nucleosidase
MGWRRSPPPDPGAPAPVLALVVALAAERRALERALGAHRRARHTGIPCSHGRLAGQDLLLLQAGIGATRARGALLAMGRSVPLAGAWSLGFAGGLQPALRTGDLVCPERVLRDAGAGGAALAASPAQAHILDGLRVAGHAAQGGPLLTVETPLRTPEAKRRVAAETAAVAVDMEAAGVAEAAAELGIPWLALKVILDPADRPLDGRLARCSTPEGNPRWPGILAVLAAGPEARRMLWTMRRAARLASRRLACSLEPALLAWPRLDAARALQ